MFTATVTKQDNIKTTHTMSVYTDTLFEAELYVQAFFTEAYNTQDIKLVYMYDLEYCLYVDGMPEAYVLIKMIE